MMSEITGYREEVQTIKTAILRAQYAAAKSANAQQLQLYFAVGGYVSANTRNGTWGTSALKTIRHYDPIQGHGNDRSPRS